MLSFPAGWMTGPASWLDPVNKASKCRSSIFFQSSMIRKHYFGPAVQTLALVRCRTDLKVLLLVYKAQGGSGSECTKWQTGKIWWLRSSGILGLRLARGAQSKPGEAAFSFYVVKLSTDLKSTPGLPNLGWKHFFVHMPRIRPVFKFVKSTLHVFDLLLIWKWIISLNCTYI